MALFKQVEFAKKCGVSKAHLSVNKGRGKVIVNEAGMIDDSDPINKIFLEHCLTKLKKNKLDDAEVKKNKDTVVETKSDEPKPAKNKKSAPEKNKDDGRNEIYLKNFNVDMERKQSQIAKMQTSRAIEEMKLKKMEGQLIDKELAWGIFTQQFKFFNKAFYDGVESILTEIVKKARLNRNDHAEMRTALIKIINNSTDRAVDDGKKHFSSLIKPSFR